MTAGAQVVCDAVARKVEVDGLNVRDVNEVDAVVNASDVLFSAGVEVSAHDPGDIVGVNVGDLAGEVDPFKKVDPLVLEANGGVHVFTLSNAEVKAVKDDVNVENGSAVDPPVVVMSNDVTQGVKCSEEVDDSEVVKNVEAETDEIGSGITFVPESTLNTVESSQVTVCKLESAVKASAPDVMVNDGLESVGNRIGKTECEVTIDESESSGSPIVEREGQAKVDGSGKPSEDLGSQVTDDEKEFCGSPIKEGECEVTVNGSDSIGSFVENQECPVSVDESETCVDPIMELNETTNTVESERKSNGLLVEKGSDSLSVPEELTVVEQKVERVSADDDEKETEVKDAETGVVENVVCDNEEKETEVKDAHAEFVHDTVPENRSAKDMDCETEVKYAPVGDHSTSFSGPIMNHGAVIEFGSFWRHESTPSIQNEEVEDLNGIQSDAIDVHNEEVEVLEYNFLVKIPRFEDEALRDQIRSAHVEVEQKTLLRGSIRAANQEKRDKLKALTVAYNAARREETATRRLIRNRRQEIEAVQAIIDRWKNAMTVQDIDLRISCVERMIQHETLELADEKQFIREIRQLKSLRDELALGMGTAEEIRHAIDTKDRNEERLKVLRKELDALKSTVAKAEAVKETIKIQYDEGNIKEYELQDQFRAADDDRQRAYAHLNSLKKLSYDKNSNFRQFKQDLSSARKFLMNGDKDALHSLCANQVETFMEQWNNDDDFRKEYVSRCNMIASRRQKVQDGAPPVSDDVPSEVTEKLDGSPVSVPDEVKHVSLVLPEDENVGKSIENVTGEKNLELKTNGVVKPTNSGSDDMAKEESEVAVVTEVAVAEKVLTKEEIELARKAEEEMAAKLKEQRRLEEKAKAMEALERKKRNAEKAQLRAELRARKEAEQKEKEREKRLRKKEKKTGGGDGSVNGEDGGGSESSNEAKESETVNKKKTQKPPAHFFSKQLKSKPVPAVLINKNKKHWQQYINIALVLFALGLLALMINCGIFADYKPRRFNTPF